ncbi:MAG TPA: sulfite oxidase [Pirellulales bacterium]|nr:sulfite oxidase [Pirellulales bacterium]
MPRHSTRRACSRRAFLKRSTTAFAVAGLLGAEHDGPISSALADDKGADAARLVPGKDRRLVVHNAKTLEFETPLALLRDHQITPKSLLFVRNNQELADMRSLEPPRVADWSIEFAGQVESPRQVTLEALARREQAEVEMVLQCSGNGRALFAEAAKVKGSPWQQGALGHVRFRGVPLAKLLESLDLGIAPHATFLTAEGRDGSAEVGAADFEHSIPLADALARSLLALEMNGGPIPAIHGGPVRLVTPGYYGTMHIKWLSRLRFEPRETFNHHQRRRYRTPSTPIEPGSDFVYDFDNSDPNWRMRIKSVIFAPLEGEMPKAGEIEARGVAFNDGAARIESVELSLDEARTWRRAELKTPSSPYAWYPWRSRITLARGRCRILARAVDALGRSQPLDGAIDWNPAGYGWHGVHSVEVTAV